MQGHTNDYVEKTQPVDYGNGAAGFTYDWQGIVNNINLGLPPTGGVDLHGTHYGSSGPQRAVDDLTRDQ